MEKSRKYLEEVVRKAIIFYNGFGNKIDEDFKDVNAFDIEAITLLVLTLYNINFGLEVELDCYSEEFKNFESIEQYIDLLYKKVTYFIE